jgi:PAS domain S-box-containing protein
MQSKAELERWEPANSDLGQILGASGMALLFLDPDQRVAHFTESMARIAGLEPADKGRPVSQLVTALPGINMATLVHEATTQATATEQEFRHPDGAYYVTRCMPCRAQADTLGGMIISIADVTRVKREGVEALQESENRFITMVNFIPQLAWVARADGYIYWYNQRWHEYAGTTPEAMEGWGWQSVHDPRTLPAVLTRWKASIATGEPFEMTFPLLGADGVYRQFLTRVFPMKDPGGQVVQWFGTNTDVDEFKRLEDERRLFTETLERKVIERTLELEQANAEKLRLQQKQIEVLRQAERAKDQFLAVISHELRTPLNFITGFASLMDDAVHGALGTEYQGYVAGILKGADRMLELVNDLLDVSRMAAGKFEICPTFTPFEPIVAEALSSVRHSAEGNGIALSMDVQTSQAIAVDARRMFQVLTNLVRNAIKHTPAGGSVNVSARVTGPEFRVEVQDDGKGIAAEDLPKLFRPFSQVDMSDTRAANGSGLGLFICRTIVEAHGGHIGVTSEPGTGSTFWFTLPIEQRPGELTRVTAGC